MSWQDFNLADDQTFSLIPNGTIAKARLDFKLGNYNDAEKGWTNNYATKNPVTNTVYLATQFTILNGEYKGRKIWVNIGLHSDKSANYESMGKVFIKNMLNSAHGLYPGEMSEHAIQKRQINDFSDLERLTYIIQIAVITNPNDQTSRNTIKKFITPEHKLYSLAMSESYGKETFFDPEEEFGDNSVYKTW